MLSIFAKISSAILLISIFYWAYYLDKNKKDERSEQILGKASKYSFLFTYISLGFFAIFYLNGHISPNNLFDLIIVLIAVMSLINTLSIFVYNKKMS
ncbi:hypothetical protein CON48_29325 [Bacillus thuringiensis]|uniref:DUF2178 domain-containing protein n=3 Tax=Bacillus cereus group TaxID=86661 RepID=A0A9X6YD32_BACTU|nr:MULTISPECIES: hypothetical protein [Bacillus]EEL64063.1 hypothetical protein bcere0025_31070 [Bacillus cereus F65185]EJR29451.1 hypothetical protein IIE_05064 [Bacillus cereus VD045]EJR72981.1 hypothetical protein IK7_05876 [Bacillus cereus VD156]EKS7869220.1 hypothetical protein [Bacillus cereus]EOO05775.1 hypothetical protein IAW_05084 [Bacillus cereus str. Schrouff]